MYTPRLKLIYSKIISLLLQKKRNKNIMQIPSIKKIVINIGLGEAIKNNKCIELCSDYLLSITGQKPVVVKAKKSIAFFKLRKGMPIGLKVTLRNNKMWEFIDRFLNIALPRVRDFKGIKVNFDSLFNFSIGIKENIIFPEITYDKIDKVRGLGITFITNSLNKVDCLEMLKLLGFPFKR